MFNRIFLILCLLFLIQLDVDAQCAMCRTTIESTVSNGRSNIATGLNTGILYLLTAPYLLVGGIARLWFKQSKQEQKERIAKWQLRQRVSQILGKSN